MDADPSTWPAFQNLAAMPGAASVQFPYGIGLKRRRQRRASASV
jgi:hypothetical protein